MEQKDDATSSKRQPTVKTEVTIIRKTAKAARTACEDYIRKQRGHNLDCHNPETLLCFCGIASVFLMELLREEGIPTTLVSGTYQNEGHCWLEYEELKIDITLTQFSRLEPKVMIRRKKTGYSTEMRGRSIRETFQGWPSGQYPTRKRIEALKRQHAANTRNPGETPKKQIPRKNNPQEKIAA